MKTSKLAAVAVVLALAPAVVSFGCNKKEDLAPAPSATPVATLPPPTAAPAPPPAAPAAPPVPQKVAAKLPADAGTGTRDSAVVLVAFPDAAVVQLPPGLPQIPTIHPSALPAIASGIVGGIIGALPSGLIPPAPAPSR
jgi:hypothetical protein